ncbi:MAG TPA: anaerobic ribonucleoside-triphosphate reductase activating protein [archaeon]|nr:anaerobic ribonucleoside-triphosphate reductase activating protein [archaeon]
MEVQTEKNILATSEESPVYALLRRPSLIDFPGRLCRLMFISGCNMQCIFCHNNDLIKPQKPTIKWDKLKSILLASRGNWVNAVCISGGEPTFHPELKDLIHWLKDLGFQVKLDTNGTRPEVLAEVLPYVDYAAMDYKAPLEAYREITEKPDLDVQCITESVKLIKDWDGEYEFRTTVIDGFHREEDMLAICREIGGGRRYVIQAYVPLQGVIPRKGLPTRRTPMELLRRFHELCKDHFKDTILRGA